MEIRVLKVEDKMIRFSIVGEDYTLGNLLQNALLEDARILGAGFFISHPLSKELVFTIYFKRKTSFKSAKKIILQNIEKIKNQLLDIKDDLVSKGGE